MNSPFDLLPLALAIASVESDFNPYAHNIEENAVGALQIRPAAFQDAQSFDNGLRNYKHKDCTDFHVAFRVLTAYVTHYGNQERTRQTPSPKVYARIWNGGPDGYKKLITYRYWLRVEQELTRTHSIITLLDKARSE